MFEFRDLFQWDRFITPTIIKTFYWLGIALICLFGIRGIFFGLAEMAVFIALVFVAYVYVWKKGGLDWGGPTPRRAPERVE